MPHLINELVAMIPVASVSGVIALAIHWDARRSRPAVSTKPDYARIAELEREDAQWRSRERNTFRGRPIEEIHLELDALWRHYRPGDPPEVHERIRELTADYVQALSDQQEAGGNDQ
jgi:hypothetical protein